MVYVHWILASLAGVVVSAIIIHLAAVIVGPSDRGFAAALISAFLLYILAHIALIPLIFLTGFWLPWWVFIVIAMILAILVIKGVYDTAYMSAIIMWVIAAVFNAVYSLFIYGPLIVNLINAVRAAGGREPL
jgi:hypothetical protein